MTRPRSSHRSKRAGSFSIVLVLILATACNFGTGGSPTPVSSQSWYVAPSGNDKNDCRIPMTPCLTISTAISRAVDGDTIFVSPGTYPELLSVMKSISIKGVGTQPSDVVIDGKNTYQVLYVGCMACSIAVSVTNLTVQNGLAPASGGLSGAAGVSVDGATLTMSKVVIQNNNVAPGGEGIAGGIFVSGTATLILSDATITGNANSNDGTEPGGWYNGSGGGIYNLGTLTITGNVTLSKNSAKTSGGGLYNAAGGQADLTGATLENNTSQGKAQESDGGGGIYSAGTLHMTGGTIKGNTSQWNGGGLLSTGVTTLSGVTVDGNAANSEGGGICQLYGANSTRLTATDISVVNNHATLGAGVANEFTGDPSLVPSLGYLDIEQSTLANNGASGSGGGVLNENRASMYLTNDTISNNSAVAGGGIATGENGGNGVVLNVTIAYNKASDGAGIITGGGDLTVQNDLLGKNAPDNCSNKYGGTITSEAGNLSSDNSCNFQGPLDRNNLDPKIGQLADNDGSTQTIALEKGSPAIDAGLEWLAPQVDQRGDPRGGDGNGDGIPGFDIGAFEVIPQTQGMSAQITMVPITVTLSSETFTVSQPTFCRSGPALSYPVMTNLPVGAAPAAVGRNADGSWFYVYQPGKLLCWVRALTGSLSGNPSGLPVQAAGPTPTPVPPAPTPKPKSKPASCSSFTDQGSCSSHGCTWHPGLGVPGYCS